MVENNTHRASTFGDKKYNLAIIGSPDSVLGWKALGLETFGVMNKEEILQTLEEIEKGDYAIVFITENWYEQIPEEIKKLQQQPLPAVISVPSQHGSTGAGLINLRKIVEQAVGSDILFNK